MPYTPSKVLKNAIIVGLIVLFSDLATQNGIPTIQDLYHFLVAAALAAILSYERQSGAAPVQSTSIPAQIINKVSSPIWKSVLDLLP